MKPKQRRSVEEILESTKEFLFPTWSPDKKVKLNSQDCMGDTPLHILASRGDAYGVRTLVAEGARLNVRGDMGLTPLHAAVSSGNTEVVTILLEAGADPSIVSEFGTSAKEQALQSSKQLNSLFKRYT